MNWGEDKDIQKPYDMRPLERRSVNGRIIIKWILKKYGDWIHIPLGSNMWRELSSVIWVRQIARNLTS